MQLPVYAALLLAVFSPAPHLTRAGKAGSSRIASFGTNICVTARSAVLPGVREHTLLFFNIRYYFSSLPFLYFHISIMSTQCAFAFKIACRCKHWTCNPDEVCPAVATLDEYRIQNEPLPEQGKTFSGSYYFSNQTYSEKGLVGGKRVAAACIANTAARGKHDKPSLAMHVGAQRYGSHDVLSKALAVMAKVAGNVESAAKYSHNLLKSKPTIRSTMSQTAAAAARQKHVRMQAAVTAVRAYTGGACKKTEHLHDKNRCQVNCKTKEHFHNYKCLEYWFPVGKARSVRRPPKEHSEALALWNALVETCVYVKRQFVSNFLVCGCHFNITVAHIIKPSSSDSSSETKASLLELKPNGVPLGPRSAVDVLKETATSDENAALRQYGTCHYYIIIIFLLLLLYYYPHHTLGHSHNHAKTLSFHPSRASLRRNWPQGEFR